jgi:hypothetical protein
MNLREMNLRIFKREPVPQVFFQPRLEPWFFWHKTFKSLPERYQGMNVLELYDDIGISNRYFDHFTGMPVSLEAKYSNVVRHKSEVLGQEKLTTFETPYGTLTDKRVMTVDRVWRKTEFAVKSVDDLKKLEWLYDNTSAFFNADLFNRGAEFQGNRGEPQFSIHASPYETMTQEWMTFEDFIYALVDVPDRMERVMNAIDRSTDEMFEQIISFGGVNIVNFPENIDVFRVCPDYFERYLIPWYEKRANQLRRNGIYSHIHIDGSFKPLLKYLKNLPFDGLEGLTPLPQGDVTLEEIREHIGEKILLDGIPSVFFLDHFSMDQMQECVEKLVEHFHPRLVLGVSDEMPQGAGDEGLKRIQWIADHCQNTGGN